EEDEGEDEDDEEKAEGNGRTTGAQDGCSRSRPCRRRTAARCGTADAHRGPRCQLPPDPLPATAGPAGGLPRDAAFGAVVRPPCHTRSMTGHWALAPAEEGGVDVVRLGPDGLPDGPVRREADPAEAVRSRPG